MIHSDQPAISLRLHVESCIELQQYEHLAAAMVGLSSLTSLPDSFDCLSIRQRLIMVHLASLASQPNSFGRLRNLQNLVTER